jgi:hypothetical protein
MTPHADDLRRQLKALEGERLGAGQSRFLFSGAARLTTPLHELAGEDEELARTAHAVCRRCKDVVCHVFEFAHDPLEALSFLGCQGWPTPLLDLTASAEAALSNARHAVTVVDLAALPEHLVACDSAFLAHCRDLDGPPRQWLARRGVTLTHAEWRNFDTAADFELDTVALSDACRRFEFDDPGTARAASAPGAATEEFRGRLRAAIRTAGRKILGPAGVEPVEALVARVLPA